MSQIKRWLDTDGEYYGRYPNEIIYAHTLVKAMEAILADLNADDPVSDLVVKSVNANTDVSNPPPDPKRKANT